RQLALGRRPQHLVTDLQLVLGVKELRVGGEDLGGHRLRPSVPRPLVLQSPTFLGVGHRATLCSTPLIVTHCLPHCPPPPLSLAEQRQIDRHSTTERRSLHDTAAFIA